MLEQNSRKIQSGALLVIASLISPIFGLILSLICISRDTDEWQPCVFSISLFMAVIAYNYNPTGTAPDLIRYFQMIDAVAGMKFSEIMFTNYSQDLPMYTFNLMRWICVITEDKHLLPGISVFLVYEINLYIVFYLGKKNQLFKETIAYMLIVLCCSGWCALANNIRNVLAFSIVTLAVFRETEEEKRNPWTYFLYVIAIFLHPTAVVLILLRLALILKNKIKYVVVAATVLIQPIISMSYSLLYRTISNNLINRLLYMANSYYSDTSSAWGVAVQASTTQHVLKFASMAIAITFVVMYITNTRKTSKSVNSSFAQYSFYLSIATLACMPIITPAYWRFSYPTVSTNCINYYDNSKNDAKTIIERICPVIIGEFALILSIIDIYRNRNISIDILKSFDWFLTSPAIIIGRDIFRAIL